MKTSLLLAVLALCFLIPAKKASATPAPDHALFTAILADHVRDNRVDYVALRHDSRLPTYLNHLAAIPTQTLAGTNARLAYWINLYNAATLSLVAKNYPIKSITDLSSGGRVLGYLLGRTAWDIRFIEADGRKLTLNDIEHKILRKQFNEPRIHFAIVCAAIGCPRLRAEAYQPEKLSAQLDDQGRWFWQNRNHLDPVRRRIELSPIFKWFAQDFGPDRPAQLRFIAQFAPSADAAVLQAASVDLRAWDISHSSYDWSLNHTVTQPRAAI